MQLNNHGLYDIYEMSYVPFWQTSSFFWCIIIIFGCLLACSVALITRFLLKRKKHETAWGRALIQLDALDSAIIFGSLSDDKIKEYYFVMTATLKHYIAARYDWSTVHLTDSEFVDFIDTSDRVDGVKLRIKNIYDNAVMIKFADKKTIVENLKNDVAQVRALIYATMPDKNV